MLNNFELKCKKCNNNIKIDIEATSVDYGNKCKVKFVCVACGHEAIVPVTQVGWLEFEINSAEGLR